jgi:hypothetical protein
MTSFKIAHQLQGDFKIYFATFPSVRCLHTGLLDVGNAPASISQLRYQLQAIDEITSEKELVNIVLNGLPKTWDAFSTSMNTRKEYPTFE